MRLTLTALQVLRGWRGVKRMLYVVDAAAHAVDPAEAQRLVDGLRPRDARPHAALLVEAKEEFAHAVVVALELCAEVGGGGEERRLHGRRTLAGAVSQTMARTPATR